MTLVDTGALGALPPVVIGNALGTVSSRVRSRAAADGSEGELTSKQTIILDDALPSAVKVKETFVFDSTRKFSGSQSVKLDAGKNAYKQSYFENSSILLPKNATFFLNVWLDTAKPSMVMTEFQTKDGWHHAYWGENKYPAKFRDKNSEQHIGNLPATGRWVTLEFDAFDIGLEDGGTITGMAVSIYGGRAWFDKIGFREARIPDLPVGLAAHIDSPALNEKVFEIPKNAKKEMYASLWPVPGQPGKQDLIINGPTRYGFKLRGVWTVQNLGGAEVFKANSAELITPVLNIPLGSISVSTTADSFKNAGQIKRTGSLSGITIGGSQLFAGESDFEGDLKDLTGLSFGNLLPKSGIGIDLGVKLTGSGATLEDAPLADAIPYFFFKAGAGSDLIKFGDNSISMTTFQPELKLAFDPADPSLYVSIATNGLGDLGVLAVDSFELAGSIKGRLKWGPKETPKLFKDAKDDGTIYGHIFLKGKIVIPAHRLLLALGISTDGLVELGIGIEGDVVLDLDANNDGDFLNLVKNSTNFVSTLVNVVKGQKQTNPTSIDAILLDGLFDMRFGANAKITAELGLGPEGVFGLTVPVGAGSILWKNNMLALVGTTLTPLKDTPLGDVIILPSARVDLGFSVTVHSNDDFELGRGAPVLDKIQFSAEMRDGAKLKIKDFTLPLTVTSSEKRFELKYTHSTKHLSAGFKSSVNVLQLFDVALNVNASIVLVEPKTLWLIMAEVRIKAGFGPFKVEGTGGIWVGNNSGNKLYRNGNYEGVYVRLYADGEVHGGPLGGSNAHFNLMLHNSSTNRGRGIVTAFIDVPGPFNFDVKGDFDLGQKRFRVRIKGPYPDIYIHF